MRTVRVTSSNIGLGNTKKSKFTSVKVRKACDTCHQKRVKCDSVTTNRYPCAGCTKLKLQCVLSTVNHSRAYTPGRHNVERVSGFDNSSGGGEDQVNSEAPHTPYTRSLESSNPSHTDNESSMHYDDATLPTPEALYHSQSSFHTSNVDPVDRATQASNAPTSSRKRRNGVSGAADDCFACHDSHTRCDRQRPYCTQCLEGGESCPGYMTNLTWGHGVASRGLLRGLSLPVASNKKVPPVETEYTRKKTSGPSKSNAAVQPTTPSTNIIPPDSQSLPNLAKRNKDQRTAPQANPKKSLGRHSLEPPHATDLPMQEFHAIDMTTSGLGEYTHFEAKLTKGQNTESNDVTHLNEQLGDGEVSFSTELSLSIPSLSIGKTPRLRFLIKHYENVISPIIVAFDGPTNPYRTHILRLANESDALQNAIAAFSASKIRRMREYNSSTATQPRMALADTPYDKAVQQFSVANTTRDDDFQYTADTKAHPRVPSREELYYKRESIRTLNAQLADPSQRKDDSILATILILCFYDICSAGVAKFKTQFAGVKKILALRGTMSKEVAWLMTMFTWFDAMAATVNDREGQFQDSTSTATYLFPFPPSIPEWTLENLAGCDGRLFSTIARLGRLNLLSLGESVANSLNATPKPQLTVRSTQYYSMNYAHFDGNDLSSLLSNPSSFPTLPLADPHAQFWSEWQTISSSLHSWSLDLTTLPPSFYSCHRLSSDLNRLDLLHISQSFRYAALLYIERLAYPSLPSSASNFQYLVQQGLYYIAQVKSDVNLFWPLFITGTECVEERHRGVIKGRCLSIQRDSGFFNKILGLELLERAWREADMETGAEKLEGKAFRWREAMGVMDGELIVV